MLRSADEFFNLEGLREVRFKSREKLISMRIEDFLALAEHGYDPDKEETVERVIREGHTFDDVPGLLVAHDGDVAKVTGHEGRHRARALRYMGYTHIPVKLIINVGESGYSIRWSEQYDPKRFDYTPIWPEVLEAEYGSLPTPDGFVFQIPFPVSREDAGAAYVHGEIPTPHEDTPEWIQESPHEMAGTTTTPNTIRAPRMR